MYLCDNCKKDFDIAESRVDDIGYPYTVCPFCGSEEYEVTSRCAFSGAYVPYGETFSKEVYRDISKELDAIAESWGVSTDETTEAFLDVLTAYIEGRE